MAGNLQRDIVIHCFFSKVLIVMPNDHEKCRFDNCCREYSIRDTKYDIWLFNNGEWKPRPSVAFATGVGPVMLTCQSHSGGTQKHYIHYPWQPNHVIPSEKGDLLCYACINPLTIKTINSSKYCTKYQMN